MVKKFCDICNKEEEDRFFKVSVGSVTNTIIPIKSLNEVMDLCPECHEKLTEFLKGKKVG